MFVDYAEIEIAAGDGGKGAVSFHREKFVPKGGPDGGDGGKGGDVYIKASANMSTLLDFRYKKKFRAQHGAPGGKNNRFGRDGRSITIELPVGTIIADLDTGRKLADLTEHGREILLCKGGKGGRGNTHFKSSTNQIPRKAEDGQPGEKHRVSLELKSIADVGLVGLPNAGKSTLLARVSAAHPKIADYPFTTKVPNLGIVPLPGYKSFVMADIPGLIEGAHLGKGMGIQFLRHIQRTRVLVYLLDITSDNPRRDFDILVGETKSYDSELVKKSSLVVFNKIDLIAERPPVASNFDDVDSEIHYISAATGENVDGFLQALARILFSK
ncbi:MAG: GTPase ObgE [candidate division Zixibacteria bacterium RBG_16_53_22]|nr:MAG: GTPase ObgE [candidate division Zixibacteria bacterium RBG_16_53_22]